MTNARAGLGFYKKMLKQRDKRYLERYTGAWCDVHIDNFEPEWNEMRMIWDNKKRLEAKKTLLKKYNLLR